MPHIVGAGPRAGPVSSHNRYERSLAEVERGKRSPATVRERFYSSAAMASNAAAGSSACVMGRPTTICEAPFANASTGVATRL